MTIVETKHGDQNFAAFEQLPNLLYGQNGLSANQATKVPSDFLHKSYLLADEGLFIGRASLYLNPNLYYDGEKTACIGNYEMADNVQAASFLLNNLQQKAKYLEVNYLLGPMNGSTWERYRLALDWDAPLFATEQFHPLYYNAHFLENGFDVVGKYHSNSDSKIAFGSEEDKAFIQNFQKKGVKIRELKMENWQAELERIYRFTIEVFKDNFLYTPISLPSFLEKYLPFKNLADPYFILIAEDADDALVGYFFCFPDFLERVKKSIIVKTIARHPDEYWKGLGRYMALELYRRATEKGFTTIIHAFIFGDGRSRSLSEQYSGTAFRHYHLYGKRL